MMHKKQMPPCYPSQQTALVKADLTDIKTHPEESGIVAPVPSGRVQHIRRQDAVDDANDITIPIGLANRTNNTFMVATSLGMLFRRPLWG